MGISGNVDRRFENMEKNKEEFLRNLRQALSGQIPPEQVKENLRYYEDYIRAEVHSGNTECQVMEALGDARLIARTIIDATPGSGDGVYEEYGNVFQNSNHQSGQEESRGIYANLSKWYRKALLLMTVILTLAVILMVIGGVLTVVVPLIPLFCLVCLSCGFLRKYFSGDMRILPVAIYGFGEMQILQSHFKCFDLKIDLKNSNLRVDG